MFDDFYSLAHQLQFDGRAFATAVVVRAEKPTSARPGDKAIITAEGALHGWIGGSCAQPTVVEAAIQAITDGRSRLVRLSPNPGSEAVPEGYEEVAMTCFSGGTLDVFIEPQRPQPRLLIIGELPVAQSLVRLGQAMSYHVIAVVSESSDQAMAHADEVHADLQAIPRLANERTWIVIATHGNFDESAVTEALRSPAPYIALVASTKRAQSIRELIESRGLDAGDRLEMPAGLDIGARRGDEIALSIMAQIVKVRRAKLELSDAETAATPHVDATPLDPVCGMTVTPTATTPAVTHGDVTYYFCCPGCASRFSSEPAQFLA